MLGVQEPLCDAAHGFVFFGGQIGQKMQATVHVGVFFGVATVHRVDHHLRFLRRGAIIQIDQGLAVDFARQDREVCADFLDVVHGLARRLHRNDGDAHELKHNYCDQTKQELRPYHAK